MGAQRPEHRDIEAVDLQRLVGVDLGCGLRPHRPDAADAISLDRGDGAAANLCRGVEGRVGDLDGQPRHAFAGEVWRRVGEVTPFEDGPLDYQRIGRGEGWRGHGQ